MDHLWEAYCMCIFLYIVYFIGRCPEGMHLGKAIYSPSHFVVRSGLGPRPSQVRSTEAVFCKFQCLCAVVLLLPEIDVTFI